MGLFRKSGSQRRNALRDQRPMRSADGSRALVFEGDEDLEVVGESFHQNSLWGLVGGRGDPSRHVRKDIVAVLTAQPDNPYDDNAVAVSINGLAVGHLSREDARLYQPGLLALQRSHGRPVALRGVIVGGGIREDGPGRLGVFLEHDPEDFGLRRSAPLLSVEPRMRTGLSEALGTGNAGWSDEMARLSSLPKTDVGVIPAMRNLLGQERDPIKRHFIYAQIEARLYRCRDVFASALDEFDQCCAEHDAEMEGVRAAFMAEWGSVPLLDLYRQMAVRQQKLHDYQRALWWAQRGMALYGDQAATPEGIEDLRHRAASYRAKLPAEPRES
jgi:hypothetical protein